MTLKKHSKHAVLKKPNGGKIHRNEFGFLGASCEVIQKLSIQIAQKLPKFKMGYIDADHGVSESDKVFKARYTDKISSHQMLFDSENIEYDLKSYFQTSDAVLINSNHFDADKQIVIINNKKAESLSRKLDRLSNVLCFILDKDEKDLHDYLKTKIPEYKSIPVFNIDNVKAIADLIDEELIKSVPKINGLLLAGGKSQRMGYDKTLINYHGKSQREYMFELLDRHCDSVLLSLAEKKDDNFPVIIDVFKELGPYGGILSAFQFDPNSAWLSVAADLPLLNDDVIEDLIRRRNPGVYATCFHNPETQFPEPLLTIWEPRMYPRLLNFLSMGYSCPRKALINSEIEELQIDNSDYLMNANTPEEAELIKSKINA